MSCCKPVQHKGLWYCLGEGGSLGVFDPIKTEWRVLKKPTSFGLELAYKNCYLVESKEELHVVLTAVSGAPIYVLRLNEEEMRVGEDGVTGKQSNFTGTVTLVYG